MIKGRGGNLSHAHERQAAFGAPEPSPHRPDLPMTSQAPHHHTPLDGSRTDARTESLPGPKRLAHARIEREAPGSSWL